MLHDSRIRQEPTAVENRCKTIHVADVIDLWSSRCGHVYPLCRLKGPNCGLARREFIAMCRLGQAVGECPSHLVRWQTEFVEESPVSLSSRIQETIEGDHFDVGLITGVVSEITQVIAGHS